MDLYQIDSDTLIQMKSQNFQLERQLQNLIENNMAVTFGIEFISSEFTIGNYRLDTVAFDQDNNAFTIIEYKRSSKYSLIDQGYAYLNGKLQV